MPKKAKTVSEVLRAAIKASGLTHYRLAKMTGTTPPMVDRFVTDGKDLRLSTVDRLAEALGLELRTAGEQDRGAGE